MTAAEMAADRETCGGGCECWVTPESQWFYYGSAVEPGSQVEYNPGCPEHGESECQQVTEMTASLVRAIGRDPNGRWKNATLSEDGTALLLDVADDSGPNGMRTFLLTVREV